MENELVIKPRYTLSEELMSAISHGIGVLLAIAGMVLCIVKSASDGSAVGVVSSSLYGSFMIILYLMSTLYHSFKPNITAKKVINKLLIMATDESVRCQKKDYLLTGI